MRIFILLLVAASLAFGTKKEVTSIPTGVETVWESNDTILLKGIVFVENNAKLVIKPGALITAAETKAALIDPEDPESGYIPDSITALVVTKTGTIEARGEKDNPIIFTSVKDRLDGSAPVKSDPNHFFGFWGGIAILGDAEVSGTQSTHRLWAAGKQDSRCDYSGTNNSHNSGILQYVSIRYAGSEHLYSGESYRFAGLTLCGVGSGTNLNNIEVYKSNHDGVRFLGGTVNAKYLASHFSYCDGIHFDQGYRGELQYVSVMMAKGAEKTNHIAMRVGGIFASLTDLPYTSPFITNATLYSSQNTSDIISVQFEKRGGGYLYNSFIWGFCNFTIARGTNNTKSSWDLTYDSLLDVDGNIFWAHEPTVAISWGKVLYLSGALDSTGIFVQQLRKNKLENPKFNGSPQRLDLPFNLQPSNPLSWGGVLSEREFGTPPEIYDCSNTSTLMKNLRSVNKGAFIDTNCYIGAFSPAAQMWTDGWTAFDRYFPVKDSITVASVEEMCGNCKLQGSYPEITSFELTGLTPTDRDSFMIGDTVTLAWESNDAYRNQAKGVRIRFSPDNGLNWSDRFVSLDAVNVSTDSLPVGLGSARFVIPDSIVIFAMNTSVVGKDGLFRIEAYTNSTLQPKDSRKIRVFAPAEPPPPPPPPPEPSITSFTIEPTTKDSFTLGDTVTLKWVCNSDYRDSTDGMVVRYSWDNGTNWSTPLRSIDNTDSDTIKPAGAAFGNARFIIRDSVVVSGGKHSAVGTLACFRIEDPVYTGLPNKTSRKIVVDTLPVVIPPPVKEDPKITIMFKPVSDTINIGDTITVAWECNAAYRDSAKGAFVRFSPDSGAHWSDPLRSFDFSDSVVVPVFSASYSKARFIMPDSIVFAGKKYSTISVKAFIMVDDTGNYNLTNFKSGKFLVRRPPIIKMPEITLSVTPADVDLFHTGTQLTFNWVCNDLYRQRTGGAIIRFSPDDGATWSDALLPVNAEEPLIAVDSKVYGKTAVKIPYNVTINGRKKTTITDKARFRVEDIANTGLPTAMSRKMTITMDPVALLKQRFERLLNTRPYITVVNKTVRFQLGMLVANKNITVSLYRLNGTCVHSRSVTIGQMDVFSSNLNLGVLSSGIYLIKCTSLDKDNVYYHKFIVP